MKAAVQRGARTQGDIFGAIVIGGSAGSVEALGVLLPAPFCAEARQLGFRG